MAGRLGIIFLPVIAALVLIFMISPAVASPQFHASTIEYLDSKSETVMEFAAVTASVSAGLSAMPGDAATPIADQLAQMSVYFLIVMCALYLEKYIYPARHIEAQILADEEGHVLCLGERDCSVQRNHQKLIEESPSPAVDAAMRERLVELVREAVPKIGYTGAGTLEFLLDSRGNFWFMEMNLRLQVEHGVTEMLTGVDLVKWQIRTAAGIALSQRQEDVILNGSCIECRINARSTGKVTALHVPGGPFVRFDTFLAQGAEITPFYDPLLGKLIVRAGTREEAVRKMKAALCELVIEGVETNLEEQLALVNEPEFADGSYDLRFMESR